ncbi:hypothetical protein [ANMV-1 virus]|nr:hypothetical protein [ANMV-1 virus]
MKKKDFIARYGEVAYEKLLEQRSQWWRDHPDKMREHNEELVRKGGKYYKQVRSYQSTGIPGERHKIRAKHGGRWRKYKRIIAPNSVIHHSWRAGSAEYDGVALVEKDAHQHGIIDVIQILDGKITLFTEKK